MQFLSHDLSSSICLSSLYFFISRVHTKEHRKQTMNKRSLSRA